MINNFLSRTTATLMFLALGWCTLMAQTPKSDAIKHVSYTFVSYDGTNASTVVWVPSKGMYITAIAGNSTFPMEAFSPSGKNLWTNETGLDMRGMWWNPKKKRLEANAAGEEGWYWMSLDDNGQPSDNIWNLIRDGQNQPDFQSVLTLAGKVVVGYNSGYFYHYNAKNGAYKKEVPLNDYESSDWALNQTTVAYTGVDAYPLAVLDVNGGSILYFGLDGSYKDQTQLPADAVLSEMFRFAFANKHAWLYDVDTRTWTSYRVFE